MDIESSHFPIILWNSCPSHINLPEEPANEIKRIHIYDFDNTLYKSPAPNPNLFSDSMIKSLTYSTKFSNGGWWSEPRFLQQSINEWLMCKKHVKNVSNDDNQYWNFDIVQLTKFSAQESGTLSILMTGRKENLFSPILNELLKKDVFNEKLKFNGVFLKKEGFETTLEYKTRCIYELLKYYSSVTEISLYDDREKQLSGFQKFLNEYVNKTKSNLLCNLLYVPGYIKYLSPKAEVEIVLDIIEEHNRDMDFRKGDILINNKDICPISFSIKKFSLKEIFNYAAYSLTAHSCQKVIQYTIEKIFPKNVPGVDINKFQFNVRSIQASRYRLTPSILHMAEMIIGSACANKEKSELLKITNDFNMGITKVSVKWKLTHFGNYKNVIFIYKVMPIQAGRIVIMNNIPYPMLFIGKNILSTIQPHEVFSLKTIEWHILEDELIIDTELGYDFKYCLETFKDINQKTSKI